MLRFTFVIARYGSDVLGGAEKHARNVAEQLTARGHDVRVHTTCATSYTTWRNELPAGMTRTSGVEVHRHLTTRGRLRPFDDVTKAAAGLFTGTEWLARAWAVAQGPTCPSLIEAIGGEARQRDLFVFFSLLSQLTFAAIGQVAGRAALVPLVHEERPIYTSLARATLRKPRALLVNTEEEAARISRVAAPGLPAIGIVAVGADNPPPPTTSFRAPTTRPYLIILGRHAKTKPMLPVWRQLVSSQSLPPLEYRGNVVPWNEIALVTVGELSPLYAAIPNVVPLGFVDDVQRWDLLRGAVALINPSRYESLSLVLLEAWACGLPVIVNRDCDVTAGQCQRSGGGISVDFDEPTRAAHQIASALSSGAKREQMGDCGNSYRRARYRWDRVVHAYERVAAATRDGTDLAAALGDCLWSAAAPDVSS